ncbi:60S acidic ribosomal protein P2 [Trichuris trichiura]|uniref:Large ribosomal subunit protein P2 n=1 Tax=Trichuris trichiura TaxID=36087 RepID=A0A077YX02_TRITR|nr:60S acidic ribosomal protein P2 [Trichuris trichiura]
MRYVCAYVLAVMGGNAKPDVPDIKKILDSVGIDCDDKKAAMVVEACSGHKVDDLIHEAPAKKEESEEEDEDMGFSLFE